MYNSFAEVAKDVQRREREDLYEKQDESEDAVSNYDAPETVEVALTATVEKKEKQKEKAKIEHLSQMAKVKRGEEKNWNERFQQILEMPHADTKSAMEKYSLLSNHAHDFVSTAKRYGKIIIAETFLKDEEKTIPPMEIGGQAGGQKFLYHGILFKYALDWKGIYGSDEYAMKAAGHELKGLMSMYSCQVKGLSFPMMALIDYRGYRLIAVSVLPMEQSESLIYGSQDGGRTTVNSDPAFSNKMKFQGTKLNLKEHWAGTRTYKLLCGPGDIEGHKGKDGRQYILDFARVMPPETPVQGYHNCYLYRLLRPELVKAFHKPLSSDAYSNFGRTNGEENDSEIDEATEFLHNKVIPDFAAWLNVQPVTETTRAELIENVHRKGINIRYIGSIRAQITNPEWRQILLEEMIARCFKQKYRAAMREEMKRMKTLAESPYKALAINSLNTLLGNTEIKAAIKAKFSYPKMALTEEEVKESLRPLVNMYNLVMRVQQLTGIHLNSEARQQLLEDASAYEVVEPDINLAATEKPMNIVAHAQAKATELRALLSKNAKARRRLLNLAENLYRTALSLFPDSEYTLVDYANFLIMMGISYVTPVQRVAYFRHAFELLKCAHKAGLPSMWNLAEAMSELKQLIGREYHIQDKQEELNDEIFRHLESTSQAEKETFYMNWANTLLMHSSLMLQWKNDEKLASEWQDKAYEAAKKALQKHPAFFDKKHKDLSAWLLSLPKEDMMTIFLLFLADPTLQSLNFIRKHLCTSSGFRALLQKSSYSVIDLDHTVPHPSTPEITDEDLLAMIEKSALIRELLVERCGDAVLSALAGRKRFVSLRVSRASRITDAGIAALASGQSSLTKLDLSGNRMITDGPMVALLKKCPKLVELKLPFCTGVTDAILLAVASTSKSLAVLDLTGNASITSDGLVALLKSANGATLHTLKLKNCKGVQDVDAVVHAIAWFSPNIKRLILSGWENLTDNSFLSTSRFSGAEQGTENEKEKESEGKEKEKEKGEKEERIIRAPEKDSFADRCRSLRHLALAHCTRLTDDSLVFIIRNQSVPSELARSSDLQGYSGGRPPRLGFRILDLMYCREIGDKTLQEVAKSCPCPKKLYLGYCSEVTEEGIAALSGINSNYVNGGSHHYLRALNLRGLRTLKTPKFNLPRLVELCLSECDKIPDAHMKMAIPALQKLEKLKLSNTLVGDDTLNTIAASCKALRVLKLRNCLSLSHPDAPLPNLIDLDVHGCNKLADERVRDWTQVCPHLQRLDMSGCTGIRNPSLFCMNVSRLRLGGTKTATDRAIEKTVPDLLKIKKLYLGQSTRLTEKSISLVLTYLSQTLHTLDVSYCVAMTPEIVVRVVSGCQVLRSFAATGCPKLAAPATSAWKTDQSFKSKTLVKLRLADTAVDSDGVEAALIGCPSLIFVELAFCANLGGAFLQKCKETYPHILFQV